MSECPKQGGVTPLRRGGYGLGAMSLLGLLPLLLAHCAPVPKPQPPPLLDEAALVRRLQDNAGAWQTLKGMTRMRTVTESGSASARQALMLAKPDSLRAEVISPFGQPLLLVAAHEGAMQVYLPREQRFLEGVASPWQIARLTGTPLTAEQLVRLALYDVPLIAHETTSLEVRVQGYVLYLTGTVDAQRLDFDEAGRLTGTVYFRDGASLLEVHYSRFDRERGDFPLEVAVSTPQGSRFSLSYSDVQLNREIAVERFGLQLPAGVAVEPLP